MAYRVAVLMWSDDPIKDDMELPGVTGLGKLTREDAEAVFAELSQDLHLFKLLHSGARVSITDAMKRRL